MKNRKIIIYVLLALLIISIVVSVYTIVIGNLIDNVKPQNLTIIKTPEQKEAETPPQFKTSSPIIPPKPTGTNLALNKPVEANGYTQIYIPRNVTDGNIKTYWEGKPNSYPNVITVDLEKISMVTSIRIALNPDKIWSKRTQTFLINYSNDGKTFTELLPKANYNFDPMTGNIVDIKLQKPVKTRYIQIVFTANTGATGGQIGELGIYGSD
jgi:hypothetical protein